MEPESSMRRMVSKVERKPYGSSPVIGLAVDGRGGAPSPRRSVARIEEGTVRLGPVIVGEVAV